MMRSNRVYDNRVFLVLLGQVNPDLHMRTFDFMSDIEFTSPISMLVAAADALSAARPGARRETLDIYIKRLEKLEEIAESFDGVDKSYAIQAGREVRIIVKPEQIDDAESVRVAREISKKIESELDYPGQIKVTVIRETRAVEYAK